MAHSPTCCFDGLAAWLDCLQTERAIAVLRTRDPALALPMAQAIARGGLRLIEVTWTSAAAPALVASLRAALPDCWIGAGTLLEVDQVQTAIAAGAMFLFSPHTAIPLIDQARRQGVPLVAGALSPTEIVTAWQAGASGVKVFPVQALGGPAYIQALQGPLPQVPLIPTGGVTIDNAPDFVRAGAIAVGLGSELFPAADISSENWGAITARAQILTNRLKSLP